MTGRYTTSSAPVALVLADGRVFPGYSFGAPAPGIASFVEELSHGDAGSRLTHIGELVFNTAMSGYPEVLTDPSYTGQIVAMTYPHIGNYGVDDAWSESGPDGGAGAGGKAGDRGAAEGREPGSDSAAGDTGGQAPERVVKVAGLVVRDLYRGPVRPGRRSLDAYLGKHGIPGISGVDTRALTLHLRDHGSQNAAICAAEEADGPGYAQLAEQLTVFPAMEGRGLLGDVGTSAPIQVNGGGTGPHLVLYDCGAKANILRELQSLGCRISIVPSTATAEEIRAVGADAVMLSNGPGDPAVLDHQVAQTRELIGTMPVLGICLGHQIIAEAMGGRTGKMKFGHHGINHPVRDEITKRVFVTSQNHGFTVEEDSLPSGLDVWFRNANDGSVEGLRDEKRHIRSTQFHPESAPGPTDSRWIFREFLQAIPGYGEE